MRIFTVWVAYPDGGLELRAAVDEYVHIQYNPEFLEGELDKVKNDLAKKEIVQYREITIDVPLREIEDCFAPCGVSGKIEKEAK